MGKKIIRRNNERGSAMVELALTLPVLVMILTGLVHFGFVMHSQQVITNASRVVARKITLPGGDGGTAQAMVASYCQQAGLNPTAVSTNVSVQSSTGEVTVTVMYLSSSPVEGMLAGVGLSSISSSTSKMLRASTVMRY